MSTELLIFNPKIKLGRLVSTIKMSKELKIINDFKTLAIPLHMIAKKNGVSLHYVIKVLHNATIGKQEEINEGEKCIF